MAQRTSERDLMRDQRPPRRTDAPLPQKHRRSRAAGSWGEQIGAVAVGREAETEVLSPLVPPSPRSSPDTATPHTGVVAPAAVQRHRDDRQRALAKLAWLLPTLVAGCLGLIRIGWPALWADELATWGMVTIPWGQAWPVLQHTDATLGAYYAVMHVWVSVLGGSDVILRLPSVLAMAGAAGLTAGIGTRLATPRVGLLSGLVFAVLPATSRYGQEARPYALVVFAGALSTLALVQVLDRPRRRTLAAYAGTVALLGLLHVIALLLIAAHALVVFAVQRSAIRRWLVAAGIGMLPALPVLYLGS
jgi:hypothetical protein